LIILGISIALVICITTILFIINVNPEQKVVEHNTKIVAVYPNSCLLCDEFNQKVEDVFRSELDGNLSFEYVDSYDFEDYNIKYYPAYFIESDYNLEYFFIKDKGRYAIYDDDTYLLMYLDTNGGFSPKFSRTISNPEVLTRFGNGNIMLIEFIDYLNPYSNLYHSLYFGEIKERYIDTNIISYVILQNPENNLSYTLAEAALCAEKQGKFLEFHNKLLEKNSGFVEEFLAIGRANLTEENSKLIFDKYYGEEAINVIAKDINLNSYDFDLCVTERLTESEVELHRLYGAQQAMIGSNPSFILNGNIITDVNKLGQISSYIEQVYSRGE